LAVRAVLPPNNATTLADVFEFENCAGRNIKADYSARDETALSQGKKSYVPLHVGYLVGDNGIAWTRDQCFNWSTDPVKYMFSVTNCEYPLFHPGSAYLPM
jgi:hypothetical protein